MAEKKAVGFESNALAKNIIFSVVAFALNLFISFFITPRITNRFGSDIYGYVRMANDFANYASLFSIALNSMASRFIMLERTRGNTVAASEYFSSVGIANVILSLILLLPSALCVYFLDSLFDVPVLMVFEVKLTFALTFSNFILQLLFSIFSNCYYITNTLYIRSLRTAQASIINVAVVLGLFFLFEDRISYVVIGTLAATAFNVGMNWYYSRTLTPDLKFSLSNFRVKKVMEILSSGIWNSVSQLSQILASGLDLLITNVFLGPVMMGYMSVAKTVPNVIISFNATVGNVFCPNLMRLYAEGDTEGLKKAAKSAMRFMCLFVSIPNAIVFTMGREFYGIWVPTEPSQMIHILAVLTIINSCISGPMQPLYQIFTITNKVKESSLITIIYGVVSISSVYVALRLTDWGVYAVCGVSLACSLVMALGYHLPYTAKYAGLHKTAFVPEILKSILSLVIVILVGYGVKLFVDVSAGWIGWFTGAIITAIIGFAVNMAIVLNKEERAMLADKVKRHLPKGRGA